MKSFLKFADKTSQLGAAIASILLVLMVAHTVLEILIRPFGISTYVLDELVGYELAALIFLGLGWALRQGAVIRVDFLLNRFPGRARRLVESLIATLSLATVIFISYYFFLAITRFLERGTKSSSFLAVPLWIPNTVILIGLVIFGIQLLAYLLRAITGQKLVLREEEDSVL